jgi:di/tricarboxylate transporter
MSADGWIATLVCLSVLGLLIATRIPPYLVLVGGMVTLITTGILSPAQGIGGFASEGVVTIAALFVVSAGLRETGVMRLIMQYALGRPSSARVAQVRLFLAVAPASALLNNTPLVAMLMPVVIEWGRRIKVPATQLLIPLSYSAILGGLMTLIGTSTNLVVHGLMLETGHEGLGLLDITVVGLCCALAGGAFLVFFGGRLLPAHRGAGEALEEELREYVLEMVVEPGSPLAGRSIAEAGAYLPGIFVVEVHRGGHIIASLGPSHVLEVGDQLVMVGDLNAAIEAQKMRGMRPATKQLFELGVPRSDRCLVEAVVSGSCEVVGRPLRETDFRSRYGAVVIGVARQGARLPGRIADLVIAPGDVMLLETVPGFLDRHRTLREFYLASRIDGFTPPKHERAWVAGGIMFAMMAVASAGLMSMLLAALLGAIAMLATGCIKEEAVRRSIDWTLLVAIGASLALGRGLEVSGAAGFVATGVLSLAGSNPHLALLLVYAVATFLTEIVTNNAAAVLVFPIALATAESLGVSPMPFVIALMIAASASFATPLGYQTNLMVYGAGGYRFSDFIRVGVPMNLLMCAVAVTVTPIFWPF